MPTVEMTDRIKVRKETSGPSEEFDSTIKDVLSSGMAATLEMELVAEDTSLENTHNTAGHPNLKTYNGKQYIAYYDDGGDITLGERTITTSARGAWTFNKLDSNKTFQKQIPAFDDNHDTISIGFDEAGFMHIAWGMHNNSLLYFMMPNSESVSGEPTTNLSMVGTNENAVAYPYFFNRPSDGKLFFSFRNSTVNRYFYEYAQGTDTWTAATGTSTAGLWLQAPGTTQYDRGYISNVFFKGDIASFACTWYDNTAPHGNDLFYVSYDTFNGKFLKANGETQLVPVTPSNDDLIIEITPPDGAGIGTMGERNLYVDPTTGKISIAAQYTDSDDVQQIYLHTHDGTSSGSWSAGTQLTFRVADRRDKGYNHLFVHPTTGIWYLLFQSHKDSMSQLCIESRDAGATWSNPYPVFSPAIRRGTGSYDFAYWDANGELYAPYEISFDVDNGDVGFERITHKLRHLYLEHWIPAEGKARVETQPAQLMAEEDINIRSFSGQVNMSGLVKIGTSEDMQLEITESANSIVIDHMNYSTQSPKYQFYRAGGSRRSPSNLTDGTSIAQVSFFAYINGDMRNTGNFSTAVDGTPGASSYPMKYRWSSVKDGETSATQRLELRGDGMADFDVNPIDMFETSEPDAPTSTGARLFVQDNGAGKTQLMVRFESGASQQIAIEP